MNPYCNLEEFSVAISSPNHKSGIVVHISDNLNMAYIEIIRDMYHKGIPLNLNAHQMH